MRLAAVRVLSRASEHVEDSVPTLKSWPRGCKQLSGRSGVTRSRGWVLLRGVVTQSALGGSQAGGLLEAPRGQTRLEERWNAKYLGPGDDESQQPPGAGLELRRSIVFRSVDIALSQRRQSRQCGSSACRLVGPRSSRWSLRQRSLRWPRRPGPLRPGAGPGSGLRLQADEFFAQQRAAARARQAPEAKADRLASRDEFADLTASEARETIDEELDGAGLAEPWAPLEGDSSPDVVDALTARVEDERTHEPALVTSTVPLWKDGPGGAQVPVDLTLGAAAEEKAFEPAIRLGRCHVPDGPPGRPAS